MGREEKKKRRPRRRRQMAAARAKVASAARMDPAGKAGFFQAQIRWIFFLVHAHFPYAREKRE
jgi:hypothetical protein